MGLAKAPHLQPVASDAIAESERRSSTADLQLTRQDAEASSESESQLIIVLEGITERIRGDLGVKTKIMYVSSVKARPCD